MWFWDAVASTEPYANNLHLTPYSVKALKAIMKVSSAESQTCNLLLRDHCFENQVISS